MRKYAILLLVLTQLCFGQRPWEKNVYTKWSAKEVNQLLTDSPWTKSTTLGTANLSLIGTGQSGSRTDARRGNQAAGLGMSEDAQHENAPRVSYQVQFRSATPVRQAVARKLQLDAKYDTLPAEGKAAVDAKINEYLVQDFADVVVLQVTYTSNVPTYFSDARRYWMSKTADALKGAMYLNCAGKKLEPMSYTAGEGVFQVVFERSKDFGVNSNLALEFDSPQFGMVQKQRVLVQFNPKDMTLNGVVTF